MSTARKTTAARALARVAADDPLSASRVRYLAGILGGARLAAFVGVNRSQPSRWIKGEERPGPTAAPMLIDLEHVLARARLVWGDAAAATWLESANSYLDGARPIDVLQISGAAPVLEALDAEAWGGAR
ncbi:MAG TPA: MbcA/ParS/Xre antitoxin family protein [Mycobacterium sp.]|nr:MbcA/ParS/Xre antitoxin family protein [Mycobacterium sp.]HUH69542.1 MbcA/ParS/Xre antitoxin family protein [Mycobacterium sp.]